MSRFMDRREFLRAAGMGAAGFAIPGVSVAQRRTAITANRRQSVVVLGAGLAGLAAGYELKRAGHSVTLLEARDTAGGRVRTLRDPFSDGLYVEAGAFGFPPSHEFTASYVEEFGLPIRLAVKFGFEQIAQMHGRVFRIVAGKAVDPPFNLTPAERDAGVYGLTSLYLGDYLRSIGDPTRKKWPPASLRDLDAVSCAELLQDVGASDAAIEVINALHLGLLGFGIDSISALSAVVSEALSAGGAFYEIEGGNDQLPNALKKRLKKRFKKQAVVRRIEQDESGVTVFYSNNGAMEPVTADRVVCALPFPVLREIEVYPAFSEEKQRAIRELKLTPVTRTYLQFRTRQWEGSRLDGSGFSDLEIQNTYSPTVAQPGQRGILASFTAGRRALDMSALPESARIDMVLRRMDALFGNLNSQFETAISHAWHEDEFARGGFTYYEPGQMTTLLPAAQRSEGRIHFAGEHTSAWYGWMNGALESGNRAAEEVSRAG